MDARENIVAILERALAFVEEEAENRSEAGSEYSDYEREPRDLAEDIRVAIRSIRSAR